MEFQISSGARVMGTEAQAHAVAAAVWAALPLAAILTLQTLGNVCI